MVHPSSGYRQYTRAHVPRAVLLRRVREAQLPLVEARVVLNGPIDEARRVLAHLGALEARLGPARRAITAALAALAKAPPGWTPRTRRVEGQVKPVARFWNPTLG
jgi:DNA-binding transcriptional MerR regulator